MVQSCTEWYRVVQSGTESYRVVQSWKTYIYCRNLLSERNYYLGQAKLLNFKKEGNDEKPLTFSCNVGNIMWTQPPTKELIDVWDAIFSKNFPFLKRQESLSDHCQFKSCKKSIHVGIIYKWWEILVPKTFEIRYSHNQLFFGGGLNIPPISPESSIFQTTIGRGSSFTRV